MQTLTPRHSSTSRLPTVMLDAPFASTPETTHAPHGYYFHTHTPLKGGVVYLYMNMRRPTINRTLAKPWIQLHGSVAFSKRRTLRASTSMFERRCNLHSTYAHDLPKLLIVVLSPYSNCKRNILVMPNDDDTPRS
ncbi:hypothetical protein Hypma_009831 [Hypsizygus marmoreus]|uniref:Uncharacterized protein n=1 Tax=Hypsizygus marmoreus TaxID=39966 RepID=A0A369JLG0_HYPMA|nr:hypothetical protein Hypma_009831 [Hypsizygus marmoreus]